jgi:biopolymer transport protein ExbB
LATVAGLAVAIPALFAYNYLTVQIKDVIADMRVFSDEFIAMIAEKSADRFRAE